jgi:thiamine pyrophosphate-dependent acetolactate synthase large subunit-like protein
VSIERLRLEHTMPRDHQHPIWTFIQHGEYVERVADLPGALERAFASPKAALVNIKIGQSDFRKDAISV